MSRLDEIKARAEQVHWTSTSIEQATARIASSAADVPWLLAEVERLTAEREWFKDRFPCDGGCVDEPEGLRCRCWGLALRVQASQPGSDQPHPRDQTNPTEGDPNQ